MKVNYFLVISAVSILSLVGCQSSKDSTVQTSPSAAPAETATQPKATDAMKGKAGDTSQDDFVALQNVVTQTKIAVNAGDFKKASAEFEKFENSWSKVEDGVKAKSRSSYDRIEEEMDTVKGALKASKSDKAIAALDSLMQNVTSVAKS